MRRWLYQVGILKSYHFPVPIVVVGNIAVGGTGKTPLVIAIAHFLISQGYRPGIVSRGYGGKRGGRIVSVTPRSRPEEVGDEAILIAQHTQCPVMVGANRSAAVAALLAQSNSNVVISDDGLQHYRLARAIEIVVVDGVRRFGNQHLLPAGPLREPLSRLKQVDFVIVKGAKDEDEFNMTLRPVCLVALTDHHSMALEHFGHKRVHAFAGIGHPEHFFTMLRQTGFDVIPTIFPDHYVYSRDDFQFADQLPVVMTEKDAVKCQAFADDRFWYLSVEAEIDDLFKQQLLFRIQSLEKLK
jgi:tetraacyldisaccharide 4'-kinase